VKRLLIVGLLLLAGCATDPCSSAYRVVIPVLDAAPLNIACYNGQVKTVCTVKLEQDDRKITRELKAACIAVGGSFKDCQAQPSNNMNTLSTDQETR
jgi:hypothetical protein